MASATPAFTIDSVVAQGLQGYTRKVVKTAIEQLHGNFGFDAEQIPIMVDFVMRNLESPEIERAAERPAKKTKVPKEKKAPKEKKTKVPKEKKMNDNVPKITLPWCGKVIEGCCQAITSNQDLYTQCLKECEDGSVYCPKHTNKRPCGTVEMRMETGLMEYRDPTNNKKVKPYSVYMKKNNISDVAAKLEAERLGWEIDPVQFEDYVAKRGRPKKASTPKSAAVSDTESSSSESEMTPKPKKRGRPKKVKIEEPKATMPDLIAEKMKQNQAAEEEKVEKVEEEAKAAEYSPVAAALATKVMNAEKDLNALINEEEAKADEPRFGQFKMREPPVLSPVNTSFSTGVMAELQETEPESESEEEGIETTEWEAPDGNTYLVDEEDNVYDPVDQSFIGRRVDGELVEEEED